ncbi:peroxidase family protein [Nocardioides renjunii]|uniref:peroxidase family protein n=1 Tax=Nocardioides renjunii TaxID=3095075 RepID=UPI002AFE8F50|nr:heme peroxidase family protein [Nocardioides sp. S-34]WQQ22868.1 heme peroxidase family protein [Nocardioides sp. S-34]
MAQGTAPAPEHTPGHASRHGRESFYIEGEGVVGSTDPGAAPPTTARANTTAARGPALAAAPTFRFSRLGPPGVRLPEATLRKVALAMTGGSVVDGTIPAGFTYLGQFVDHDLTFDATTVAFGDSVSPAALLQGRSPTLDLDSLYGAGPLDGVSADFYEADRTRLKVGRTTKIGGDRARVGFDVPRVGGPGAGRGKAAIPDRRNDENLVVAQTHAAMIRFHNRVVAGLGPATPPAERFEKARRKVVLHYQWMLRTDYLPKICDGDVVTDVFTTGRKVVDPGADPLTMPTMPVEFSVAAFRLGHAMVREAYDWNARFPDGSGSLDLLFFFSGTSGGVGNGDPTLPSNWIADWRRLYRFSQVGHDELKPPPGEFNLARRIDTRLVDPLAALPKGSFDGSVSDEATIRANLAFRNLVRARMLRLASGQQMAELMRASGVPVTTLTRAQLRDGAGGPGSAQLDSLTDAQRDAFLADTPLWFYVLREAELNDGRLTGVGARLVVETFHRAMEGSTHSIVRNPAFRPDLGEKDGRFRMADLLLVAFEGQEALLAPLGD